MRNNIKDNCKDDTWNNLKENIKDDIENNKGTMSNTTLKKTIKMISRINNMKDKIDDYINKTRPLHKTKQNNLIVSSLHYKDSLNMSVNTM